MDGVLPGGVRAPVAETQRAVHVRGLEQKEGLRSESDQG